MHLMYTDSWDDDKEDLNGFLNLLSLILHGNRIWEESEFDLGKWQLTMRIAKLVLLLLKE